MYDMFDYLEWRGDLPFSKIGPNPVDLLIFSTLSYIQFDGIVPETAEKRITLREAGERFLLQFDLEEKVRVKKDLDFLEAAMDTDRFGTVEMSFYRSILDPEAETQFAAVTFYPGDGTAVLTYRGTDRTLVGWKEDFNMSFCNTIPAQREALKYLEEFSIHSLQPIRLIGHSKGGNLAVYAAAKTEAAIQDRILEIHNQDGPGFSETMMKDPGYLRIVPKISTYVPESSVVGILLEHEEPYTVIKSKHIGPMQHDPYSWKVMRNDFIHMEEMSEGSRFLDRATKTWLTTMTPKERNGLVDTIYEILTSGGAVMTDDLIHPRQFAKYVKSLAGDEQKRSILSEHLSDLVKAIVKVQKEHRERE